MQHVQQSIPVFKAIDMAMAPKRQQLATYFFFETSNSGFLMLCLKICSFHIGPLTTPGAKTCRWCITRAAGAPDVGAGIAKRPMSQQGVEGKDLTLDRTKWDPGDAGD